MIVFDLRRALKRAAFFAFFGPLIGLLLMLMGILSYYLATAGWNDPSSAGNEFAIAGMLIIFGLGFTYLIGTVPAFVTGFISSLGNSKFLEIVLAVLVGAISSFTFSEVFPREFFPRELVSMVGALSALSCVLITHRRNDEHRP